MSSIGGLVRGAVVAVAVLVGTSTAASAGFIFTAQERYVTGEIGGALGHAGPQTFTATDFGLFDAAVSLTVPTYGGGAIARQRSQLLSDVISVTGTSDTNRPAMVGTGWASARSCTSVKFDVSDATDVTLLATGSDYGSGIAFHEIKLARLGTSGALIGYVAYWDAFGTEGLFPSSGAGRSGSFTLTPGSYQLMADMQSYVHATDSADGVPNFNVSLAIPEPDGVSVALLALAAGLTRRRIARER